MSTTIAPVVQGALDHFTASPTPFHNCANLIATLGSDWVKLSENEKWEGKIQVDMPLDMPLHLGLYLLTAPPQNPNPSSSSSPPTHTQIHSPTESTTTLATPPP